MIRAIQVAGMCTVLAFAGCSGKTPTQPTPPVAATPPAPPPPPSVTGVTVTASTTSFSQQGASAQFTATVTLSDGATENRTSSATWQSSNTAAATVSSQGMVTAVGDGDSDISATISSATGSRGVSVRLPKRTADPAPGQRLPLPDVQGFIERTAAARADLLAQSCPTGFKYVNNPWLDYMVDALRTLDTRWGYNGKPNRGPADNGGMPVIAAGDEIAYHFGPGPDQGSPDVYLIDILIAHCGTNPSITFRHFTGQEPGFWTGAGRLR